MICRVEGCTNPIIGVNKQQRYCSDECRKKAQYLRNREETKKKSKERKAQRDAITMIPCVECGTLFQPTRSGHKRCSEKCRGYTTRKILEKEKKRAAMPNQNYKKFLTRGKITYSGYGRL